MATHSSAYRAAAPARVEQRQERRHRLTVTRASLRRHGAPAADARLHDISRFGCRLAESGGEIGERLWLRFAGSMPIAATVMWVRDDQLGCRFDAPLDRGLVRQLILDAG